MTTDFQAFEASACPASTAAELRLRRHAEFQRVYNASKKQHGKQMSFFAALREVGTGEYAGPRVGLTVGKVMGKAHVRNRIKRRMREALRAEHLSLRGLPVDVVLHPRRSVESLPFAQLRAEVGWVFRRVTKSLERDVELAARQRGSIPGENASALDSAAKTGHHAASGSGESSSTAGRGTGG